MECQIYRGRLFRKLAAVKNKWENGQNVTVQNVTGQKVTKLAGQTAIEQNVTLITFDQIGWKVTKLTRLFMLHLALSVYYQLLMIINKTATPKTLTCLHSNYGIWLHLLLIFTIILSQRKPNIIPSDLPVTINLKFK